MYVLYRQFRDNKKANIALQLRAARYTLIQKLCYFFDDLEMDNQMRQIQDPLVILRMNPLLRRFFKACNLGVQAFAYLLCPRYSKDNKKCQLCITAAVYFFSEIMFLFEDLEMGNQTRDPELLAIKVRKTLLKLLF